MVLFSETRGTILEMLVMPLCVSLEYYVLVLVTVRELIFIDFPRYVGRRSNQQRISRAYTQHFMTY